MESLRWPHIHGAAGALLEVGCSSASVAGHEDRPHRRRSCYRGIQGANFESGRKGIGPRRRDKVYATYWNCEKWKNGSHLPWDGHFGQESPNFLPWSCGCWGVRAQRLGLEANAWSSIRGATFPKHPLNVSVREELVRPVYWRQPLRKRFRGLELCALGGDPYEALGVPTTATDKEIKQAYRKLALKLHPDVNKEPDAEKKFMQVKNAYQLLTDEKSRAKYDASKRGASSRDPFSWQSWQSGRRPAQKQEEEFYGFEAFFRDLQADAQQSRQTSKPKSLWEELTDIGEEFVEFLEKELNITDATGNEQKASRFNTWKDRQNNTDERDAKKKSTGSARTPSREQVEAEIEDMLANLKKEMGKEK